MKSVCQKEKHFPVITPCIGRKPRKMPLQDLRSFLFAKAGPVTKKRKVLWEEEVTGNEDILLDFIP